MLLAWPPGDARAQDPPPAATTDPAPTLPPPEAIKEAAPEGSILPAPVDEVPPPPPRKNGVVLESALGALGFMGQFRHVAPLAFWMHTQLGYEPLKWLMVYGEGELFFTDT